MQQVHQYCICIPPCVRCDCCLLYKKSHDLNKKTSLRRLPVHGDTGPVIPLVGSSRFLSQHDAQHDGCCAVKLERLLSLRGTRGTWYIWHIYQINDTLFLIILFHICFCRHAGRQRFLLYDYLVSAVSVPCKGWSLCNSNLHNFESHAVSVPFSPIQPSSCACVLCARCICHVTMPSA